ncbi:MAG: hypothetical protein ACHQET_04230 [Chitinophagales bacterium]
MERYLVISPHTPEECRIAVKHFAQYNAGFLTHFEWGCYDHDHTAYAFIDANSHEEALLSVPPLLRQKAKAIKMVELVPKKIDPDMHDKNA